MILNVSGRTDIIAFYSHWFMKRYEEGFVDVRNPFNKHLISRIFFDDVEAIVFCTKNPLPIVEKLPLINKPILFQITITPYHQDLEPNVPNKKEIISSCKTIAEYLGKENVYIRYDPIIINERYSVDYHIKAFAKLCESLAGYTETIIVSFVDEYKNVKRNSEVLKIQKLNNEDYEKIGRSFSSSAKKYGMKVQTCAETFNLVEFGFVQGDCLSKEVAQKLTGRDNFKKWKSRNNENCNCIEMVDIGAYNTCLHYCKYCYANYDEQKVKENSLLHNDNSSLLIGKIEKNDTIKIRKK